MGTISVNAKGATAIDAGFLSAVRERALKLVRFPFGRKRARESSLCHIRPSRIKNFEDHVATLKDPSSSQDEKKNAVLMLGSYGERAVKPLSDYLAEGGALRRLALESLGYTESGEAVKALSEFISKGTAEERTTTVRALARIGREAGECEKAVRESLETELERLSTSDWVLRYYLAEALGQIGTQESVPVLARTAKTREERQEVRVSAVNAIIKLGAAESQVAELVGILEDRQEKAVVRAVVADLVSEFSSDDSLLEVLKSITTDATTPSILRFSAANAATAVSERVQASKQTA